MYVFAAINGLLDVPYWVKRSDFFLYFDQADFLNNRDVTNVQSAYLNAWFYEEGSNTRFYIPVVSAIGCRTDLIGTRHRLAVLLPHLEYLPFAFASPMMSAEARDYLDGIPKRPLDVNEPFWIPDFPLRDNLPQGIKGARVELQTN